MKAVIFDFDGTLADTLPICYYAFQSVFKVYDHKDVTSGEIRSMFGPSETGIIQENLTHRNKEGAIEHYYAKYCEAHHHLVKENGEIEELLKLLKGRGIKLGIVTGKARRSLDISLGALQLNDLFDCLITGDDVENPKPDPEGVIKALTILGVKKSEAMFIGDSDADILAGIKANVHTIGVQWLPNYQAPKFSVKPHVIFTKVSDFVQYLEEMEDTITY